MIGREKALRAISEIHSRRSFINRKRSHRKPALMAAVRALAESLEPRRLLSAVNLVKDINQSTAASNPENFLVAGNELYFTANDGTHGTQIWKSDGTSAGTTMVTNMTASVFPYAAMGSQVFLQGSSGLWITNGTPAGTVQLSNTEPIGSGVVAGTHLFFAGNDATHGTELWESDGTAAGTILLKDINSGTASSTPASFAQINGEAYFSATTVANGNELWKSDGTAAGTVMVDDIVPGSANSNPGTLTAMGGKLYFGALNGSNYTLWTSDGTAAGTQQISTVDPLGFTTLTTSVMSTVGNTLYFYGFDSAHGSELWQSDGTSAGTFLVKDLNPGAAATQDLSQVYALNGKRYFWADQQLWQTDGTSAGTIPIISQPDTPIFSVGAAGNYLYYEADYYSQLWRTDGTAAGTVLLSTNVPRIGSSRGFLVPPANQLASVNGTVFLNAWTDSEANLELFKLPAGSTQPVLVKDINTTTPYGSTPNDFVRAGSQAFFVAWDGTTADYQLCVTDGTAANTRSLLDLGISYQMSPPISFTSAPLGNSLLFIYQNHLWISDGTVTGTQMVTSFSGSNLISFQNMTNVGNQVFFAASDGGTSTGDELWVSDGTAAGTHLVKDIYSGSANSTPNDLTAVGNTLFFQANDGIHGSQLWKSDGTAQGTVMLSDTFLGVAGVYPDQITDVGGIAYTYFGGYLWKSDGTVAGTVSVAGPLNMAETAYQNPVAIGNELYFAAKTAANGTELWKSDGTAAGTQMVTDLDPGPASSSPRNFTALGNELLFTALDASGQNELFKTDGTASGTIQLTHDLTYSDGVTNNPAALHGIRSLAATGNVVFFAANDTVDGDELWRTDGTVAGTFMVQDIGPGDSLNDTGQLITLDGYGRYVGNPLSGMPQIVPMGNFVLFAANDHQAGQELWRATTDPLLMADAGGPYQVLEGQSVTLSAAGSMPAGAPIVSYQWDLNYSGDNGNFTVDATGPTATLSNLDGPAVRIVAVRVTDANGNVSLDTAAVHVFNVPPTLNISGPPLISTTSPNYTLSLSSSDPGPDTISSWTIFWGDGTSQVVTGNPSSVTHAYPGAAANYIISATATDEDGTYNAQSIPVGTQDPTFGTNGITSNPGVTSGSKLAIQADGKIINVGGGNSGFTVSRYDADGSLDTSFGTGGNSVSDPSSYPVQAEAVAIQADGKIVVAGTYIGVNGPEWLIERLLSNGVLDATFGTGGVTDMRPGGTHIAAIAIQANGGILIAALMPDDSGGVVARLTPDGAVDSTFGRSGLLWVNTIFSLSAMILQPDGKILLAGAYSDGSYHTGFGLTRLTSTGAADSTFGTAGVTGIYFTGYEGAEPACIALQPDGKILVGGQAAHQGVSGQQIVVRYNSDGSLDSTFGNTATPGFWTSNDNSNLGEIVALAVQSDGQILMLNNTNWVLKELTANGTLNSTFGNNLSGVIGYGGLKPPDGTFVASDMALEPNGQIIVAGNTSTGSDLMRYGGLTSGPTVQVVQTASISGTFFYDTNGNGIWDSGEAISPSWGVFLDTNGDGIYESGEPELICNSQGQYTFSNLLPGTYRVHPTSATNWTETAPPGGTQFVTVSAGQAVANVNFGEVKGAAKTSATSTALFTGDSYAVNLSYGGFHSVTSWTINWGDGTGPQTITGSPTSASHTYTSASGTSPFTILAWANTVDGDAPAAPLTLTVYAAPLLNNGLLSLSGTSGNDSVSFTNSGGLLTLNLDGATKQYNSSVVTKVSYANGGGNDTINLSGAIPATLNLASGNSTVTNNDSSPVFVAAGTGKTTINATAGTTIFPANSGTGVQQLDFAAINISFGAKVVFANTNATLGNYSSHANRTLAIVDAGGLNIASGGTLDIGDNSMLLKYLAADKSATDSMVSSLLASGYTGGAWSGTGLTSSEANYDAYFGSAARAVGWADQFDVGVNSFEGDTTDVADGNEIMIKFTYYGDTDLDGKVASSDSANFSTGVHLTGDAYWEFGDFDYSGGKPTASDSQAFSTGLAAYKTFGQL